MAGALPSAQTPPRNFSREPLCKTCRDQRFIVSAQTLQVIPCPTCSDGAIASGLSVPEKALTWDSMAVDLPDDVTRQHYALKWAGQQLVGLGYGFATVYGNYGTAKSLWGKIIVAEACRRRISAKFILGKALERMLFAKSDDNVLQSSSNVFDLLSRFQVLVIDECHGMNWKNPWVGGELMRLFEERSNAAKDRQMLTVIIGQTHPQRWGDNEQVGALLSRCINGNFALPWALNTAKEPPPPCLLTRPCFCGRGTMKAAGGLVVCNKCGSSRESEMYWPFGIDLPDIRPVLPPLAQPTEQEMREHDRATAYATA